MKSAMFFLAASMEPDSAMLPLMSRTTATTTGFFSCGRHMHPVIKDAIAFTL